MERLADVAKESDSPLDVSLLVHVLLRWWGRITAGRISGTLSYGDQKVLEIAIALSTQPEFLILDEPTAGMSPEEALLCIDLIKRLSAEFGLTVLFCEHNMELVFSISHEMMVLRSGRTIIQDRPEVVRQDQAVQEAYFGGNR